ncbi:MAG: NAD(P)/FAD-dependent oxidoreductase [Bacteroidota bacterium]
MQDYDLLVVGAGASGLMCAGQASLNGLKVLLLEKMHMPACKLRITGKGRCNITNIAEKETFMQHIGPDNRFLHNAFGAFFSEDLVSFFSTIGVNTIKEQGGRIFPESNKATELSDSLVTWVKKSGVTIMCNAKINQILVENGEVVGVAKSDGNRIYAKSVVIATGGKSYPATGSTGDGYNFASKIGHTIAPLHPLLVPLRSSDYFIKNLSGLHLKNIAVNVFIEGAKKHQAFGEMEFNETGVEGPIVLSLSRKCIQDIMANKKIVFVIDLKPGLSEIQLDNRLKRDIDTMGKSGLWDLLRGLLPQQLIAVFISTLGIAKDKKCGQLTSAERGKILLLLKNFNININGHGAYDRAIITGGGVSVKEINPKTMESKLMKNLYFIGEVLDLDADTGGYNLQIAFSTGYLAGISIKK